MYISLITALPLLLSTSFSLIWKELRVNAHVIGIAQTLPSRAKVWAPLRCGDVLFLDDATQSRYFHRDDSPRRLFPLSRSSTTLYSSSVTFLSPLLEAGYPPYVTDEVESLNCKKPLLLYLPGFDGTIIAPFLQFPELGTTFDVRGMSIDMTDRSTFEQLRNSVVKYIVENVCEEDKNEYSKSNDYAKKKAQNDAVSPVSTGNNVLTLVNWLTSPAKMSIFFAANNNSDTRRRIGGENGGNKKRPIYLLGESFGGLLASAVALALSEQQVGVNLRGVVLVNPATCYDRSKLAAEAPAVAKLPPILYPMALTRLIPMFMDQYQLPQLALILSSKTLPSVIDTAEREAYMGRTAFSLPQKLKFMPRETLDWRLREWLSTGCNLLSSSRLQRLGRKTRVLIVAGEMDKTLPSLSEATRLCSIIPHSMVHVVDGAGHASTCGSRIDLAAVIRNRFPELCKRGGAGTAGEGQRTKMKYVASQGKGKYFGMEPRYNGQEVGLSPLLYWSPELYKPWKKHSSST